MTEYMFRGKPISGPAAYVLLCSIKKVKEHAPNPTDEDILALEEIAAKFDKEFEEGLRRSRDEDDVEYE